MNHTFLENKLNEHEANVKELSQQEWTAWEEKDYGTAASIAIDRCFEEELYQMVYAELIKWRAAS